MNAITILGADVWEDTGLTVLARLLGNAGTVVTQASLTAITCKVFDMTVSPPVLVTTPTVTPAANVFDTLQTADPRWTKDSTGYNFLHSVAATAFPNPDRTYRLAYLFDPATGEDFGFAVHVGSKALLFA